MNPSTPDELRQLLEQTVQQIHCSAARRRSMREELLAHLSESFAHALQRSDNQSAAIVAARQRFGAPAEVRRQLQASVPGLERAIFTFIGTKETFLSKVFWIVSLVIIVTAQLFWFPGREEVYFAAVSLLILMIIRHLCREQNVAARVLGRQWRALVGTLGIVFGPAIVLPALARIKHDHLFSSLSLFVITLGVMVTLSGIGFVSAAILNRPVQAD